MQRGLLSIFDKIYSFVRLEPMDQVRRLPDEVRNELVMALCTMPFLRPSLERGYAEEVLACDAAPEFGFGVCSSPCTAEFAGRIARLGEKRGDYVRLHRKPGDPPEVSRLGTPHKLAVSKDKFRVIVSTRAAFPAHSGVLEGHGLLLTVRYISRSLSLTPQNSEIDFCSVRWAVTVCALWNRSR